MGCLDVDLQGFKTQTRIDGICCPELGTHPFDIVQQRAQHNRTFELGIELNSVLTICINDHRLVMEGKLLESVLTESENPPIRRISQTQTHLADCTSISQDIQHGTILFLPLLGNDRWLSLKCKQPYIGRRVFR